MTRVYQVKQEADFILIQDDDADVDNARFRMTIQEQNTEIQDLSLNVEKANRDKTILIWMVYHYRAWNMSAKAQIKSLKEKLSKATKEAKEAKEEK